MLDRFLKPKFYKKCKSTIKNTNIRIDTVRRRKNAVYKFLKTDVAELIKNGLDYNAYGRIEGILEEEKRLSCYDHIQQFCDYVSNNLSLMLKQQECPEECREAVSSLIYAAARVSEIPELRDLRAFFTERYGNSLESYVNREFDEKFKSRRPSREKKIQLMCEIAQEFSISWDSTSFELKLLRPSSTLQSTQKEIKDERNEYDTAAEKGIDPGFNGKKGIADDKNKMYNYSCSDNESISVTGKDGTDQDSLWTSSSSSAGNMSEDEQDINSTKKPLPYRLIPPPYSKPNTEKDESANREVETNRKLKSIRRRFLKTQARTEDNTSTENKAEEFNQNGLKREEMRKGFVHGDEKKYGSKSDQKFNSKRPSSSQISESAAQKLIKNDDESKQNEGVTKKNGRAMSFQMENRHPKLPDYDELAARIASLNRR